MPVHLSLRYCIETVKIIKILPPLDRLVIQSFFHRTTTMFPHSFDIHPQQTGKYGFDRAVETSQESAGGSKSNYLVNVAVYAIYLGHTRGDNAVGYSCILTLKYGVW